MKLQFLGQTKAVFAPPGAGRCVLPLGQPRLSMSQLLSLTLLLQDDIAIDQTGGQGFARRDGTIAIAIALDELWQYMRERKEKKNVRARERARYETHRQKKSVKFRHSWLKEGREEGSAFSYLSSIIERSRLPTHHTRRAPYVKTRCTSCQNLLNREKSMKCLRLHWASVYWAAPSCRPS